MPNGRKLATALALLSLSFGAAAQSLSELGELSPEDRRAWWRSMSEDERARKVAEWRDQLETLSPEEKEAMRTMLHARREEMRREWDAMSPEEQEAARARMRERAENLTPEERDAMRELMREGVREKRASMTPEERKAWREKRREHRKADPAPSE